MDIALIGYGKMGKEIEKVAIERGHSVVLKIDESNLDEFTPSNVAKADVAIEFSTPSSAPGNILLCFDANVPVVSGTTGWTERMEEIKQTCLRGDNCFFYASNFSPGVNILFTLNRFLAGIMDRFPDYNVNICETHHIHKKDAPSGTAITLANGLSEKLKRIKGWSDGKEGDPSLVTISSERRGNVPGTHVITWKSTFDELEVSHRALSRKGFATGAVAAAEFVAGKKGVFSMNDLLGLA